MRKRVMPKFLFTLVALNCLKHKIQNEKNSNTQANFLRGSSSCLSSFNLNHTPQQYTKWILNHTFTAIFGRMFISINKPFSVTHLYSAVVTVMCLMWFFVLFSSSQGKNRTKTADKSAVCMYSNAECHCNTTFCFIYCWPLTRSHSLSFDASCVYGICICLIAVWSRSVPFRTREKATTNQQKQQQQQEPKTILERQQ